MSEPLLSVRNLKTVFKTEDGQFAAVDDVSFELNEGEVIGIVGESGSGKSVTALSIMGLVPNPPGRIAGGEIRFEGRNLLELPEREMRRLRGGRMAMIFQEPMTSLNPVFTVGDQLFEGIIEHEGVGKRAARDRAVELLDKVGIAAPAERLDQYPHQMSGGMRQRVMIAMALACNPKLLLADEPTTALDVTIQAQILDLLRELQEEFRMAVIMITHNLGVVAEFAHKVMVMYCGRAVETAPVGELFERPSHPYTQGLLRSIPHLDHEGARLRTIKGTVPSPFALPPGCRFAARCEHARPACAEAEPPMIGVVPDHEAACIRLTGYRHDLTRATEPVA
ncbi:ABC transporter ATP-binding protein [Marinimicrococcus flavescens]|uniref:ABC transporter ATP-binding protein n=1 Tax=Marinimicrococcus flavescens TaxID=3031815 RepID=A0AAP3XS04_9PROT|nr:ABC transporter ATP-binding protein [Marinimicrococcus flavescens]